MRSQWTARGLCLWRSLYLILGALYGILWVIPVACLSLPITLPFLLRRPRYNRTIYDPVRLVWYAPIKLYKRTLSIYQNHVCVGYRRRRHEKKFRRLEPAARPFLRERRLSQGHMRPQPQSSFLTKLSLEIRQMIYEEVITDGTLHRHIGQLTDIKRRARSQLCGVGCDRNDWERCVISNAPETWFRNTVSNRGPLALAKSCRRIYYETIDLFYGEWTLTMVNP